LRRVEAYLASSVTVQRSDTLARLDLELARLGSGVLILDLQSEGAIERLPDILKMWPRIGVVAFGLPGSDPVLHAETLGIYALAERQIDRRGLVSLIRRAIEHVAVREENRLLREESSRLVARVDAAQAPPPSGPAPMEVQQLAKALRHFDNVEALLHRLADEVASALLVARVGIFCRTRDTAGYRLRAGLRCVENTSDLDYRDDDPLAAWLARHGHVVSRANLEHVADPATRLMLARVLDQLGAEIIVPLQSRERLLGWLFVGHLSTGFPYERAHVENLIEITDCVSTTLENALLYEEVAIQKSLAETLLHSMPTGILAADVGGVVRWFNETAQAMLRVPPESVLNRPVESLGSRLADVLRRTLGAEEAGVSEEWTDPVLRRNFTVRTRRLMNKSQCLGAVAIVQDLTEQKTLKETQDRLERATFWAELAASMSHEVRNPLVAIKTFAQLLPERYQDPEFQTEFRELVSREVDRLNGIIEQINDFAHPARTEFRPVDVRACVDKAVAAVLPPSAAAGVRVDLAIPADLPRIPGDELALTEALTHLVRNAVEAMTGRPDATLCVRGRLIGDPVLRKALEVTVQDNGPGIPAAMHDKLFSPFATTKARGLGLGLPIVKRTVADHHGQVRVESTAAGTHVTLVLPLTPGESAP
jgi:nitrogen-specific signal transduction histidine kinase